jgi:hypothetical protein
MGGESQADDAAIGGTLKVHVALLAAAFALAIVPLPALAGCDEDVIETISNSGDLIELASGLAYDVPDPSDQATASAWQENEDVLVCDDVLVNKDEGGEKVSITPH